MHLDWEGDDPGVGSADIIIVGHQVNGQTDFAELCKGALEVGLQSIGSVGCQDRLVDLDLRNPQFLQLGQQLGVGRHQGRHSCGSIDAGALWLL